MEAGPLANPSAHEAFKHKNKLQEYAQRASIPLPVYQTFNEGTQHAPKFRSSVIVDGETFVSPSPSNRRREAEQNVAKFALESILMKIKKEGIPLMHNDTTFCKIILHEYAAKMKKELPTYSTSKSEGLIPTFVAYVVFDGKSFIGGPGRSKKEAEQCGARTVIEWLLGQPDASISMAEIIKSKGKLFNAIRLGLGSILLPENIMPMPLKVCVDNNAGATSACGQNMHMQLINLVGPHRNKRPLELPSDDHPGDTVANEKDIPTVPTNGRLEVPAAERPIPSNSENPKERLVCEVTQVKTEVPSEDPATLPGHLQSPNPVSGVKRSRKNKKGSNSKKMRPNE